MLRPDGREGAAADLACRAQHPWAPRQLFGLAPAGGWEEGHGGGPAQSPQACQGHDVHAMTPACAPTRVPRAAPPAAGRSAQGPTVAAAQRADASGVGTLTLGARLAARARAAPAGSPRCPPPAGPTAAARGACSAARTRRRRRRRQPRPPGRQSRRRRRHCPRAQGARRRWRCRRCRRRRRRRRRAARRRARRRRRMWRTARPPGGRRPRPARARRAASARPPGWRRTCRAWRPLRAPHAFLHAAGSQLLHVPLRKKNPCICGKACL